MSPAPPLLRANYLSGEAKPSSVEPGGAPLGVRPTTLGLALLGVLGAAVFLGLLWGTLWLLGHQYFIATLASVCTFLVVFGLLESRRNRNLSRK